MEKTVLFGNGMNQVLSGGVTWKGMLKDLSSENSIDCSELIDSGQYTMVYEQIVASKKVDELELKTRIAKNLDNSSYSESYSQIMKTNAQNYLTTNYEHYLETEFNRTAKVIGKEESETIYSVRRKVEIENGKKPVSIWNIHGSIREPKSIMLGLDHYCGYIGKIDSYIKGSYSFGEHSKKKKIESIENKLLKNDSASFDNSSWIEHFFKSNVYIVGLGMSYNETDLWWILNKRSRMKKEINTSGHIKNEIVFFGDKDIGRNNLLSSFGVEVVCRKEMETYDDFFLRTLDDIKKR